MKTIIGKNNKESITVEYLTGQETIAYHCQNSEGYCILAKLNNECPSLEKYGFIPIGASNSAPRYVGTNWYDALEKAMAARKCIMFSNGRELLEAMFKKTF